MIMIKHVDGHIMRQYAELLKTIVPPNYGFCLFVFELNNEVGFTNYISNARREDMIEVIEAQLESLKRGRDFPTPNNN
jgi:hypothetical protein